MTSKKLETLWQGASYQDNLLQSYRGYFLTIQSILIAVGAGLSFAIFNVTDIVTSIFAIILLISLAVFALILGNSLNNISESRANDVSYFHKEILKEELGLAYDDRVLTLFKIMQVNRQAGFEKIKITEITQSTFDLLLDKGKGMTRKKLGRSFLGLYLLFGL